MQIFQANGIVSLLRRYYDITADAINTVLSQQAAGLSGPAVLIDTDPVSLVTVLGSFSVTVRVGVRVKAINAADAAL